MRRPLADAGLIFILIIFLIQVIHPVRTNDYSVSADHTHTFTGRLCRKEYKITDGQTRVTLYVDHIRTNADLAMSPDEKIVCYPDDSVNIPDLGDELTFSGKVKLFETARNPGNFDSEFYYRVLHISFSCSHVKIINIMSTNSRYWHFRNSLDKLRANISKLSDICFNEEDSAIVKTMLLGDKSTLSSDTRSMYSRNGISHILAISGLHISMLGMAFYTLLKKIRIPEPITVLLCVIIMLSYGLLVGGGPSVARALLMFILRLSSDLFHRTYDMFTALIIAAVTILIEQPLYLFYSGFQFSFGAIIAVLLILPKLENVFPRILSAGLSINIATLPVYLYNYYFFPIYSVLLNLYVIPLMSVLLATSIIAIAGCALYVPLGHILSYLPHLIFKIYDFSCNLADLIPCGKIVTGQPYIWQIIIYFIIILTVVINAHRFPKLLICMALSVSGLLLTFHIPNLSPTVTFLDVGQGDCIHISDGCGTDIMIDGGSSTVSEVGKYRIESYLLSQGIASLDAVFITHLDSDHYNGILELINDSGVSSPYIERIFISSATALSEDEELENLLTVSKRKEIPMQNTAQGDVYIHGNIRLYNLYPKSSRTSSDKNEQSMVLLLDMDRINVLFTGDLEGIGESDVTGILLHTTDNTLMFADGRQMSEIFSDTETNILKVAHHGSQYSTYESFIYAFNPELAIISVGRDNSYGHPHSELIARLNRADTPFFCTRDYGALKLNLYHSTSRSRFLPKVTLRSTVSRYLTSDFESTRN